MPPILPPLRRRANLGARHPAATEIRLEEARILVLGAGGFIGSRVVAELRARHRDVVCAGTNPEALRRRFPGVTALRADLRHDRAEDWLPRLAGIGIVINAAGVLRRDLAAIHATGPAALFAACAEARVPCVLQISALGAGTHPEPFLATKAAADARLAALARETGATRWCALRPSIVIGRGGASTATFSALAAAPWPIRLGRGDWRVQPVHVADLARAIADLAGTPALPPQLDIAGPAPMTTDELTRTLRAWLGLASRRFVTVPLAALRLAAAAGDRLPKASLTTDTLALLRAGNTADPAQLAALLGWTPRPLAEALAAEPATAADIAAARLLPLHPFVVSCLATVWIGTGLASFLVTPARASALLATLHQPQAIAAAITWSGAALDVALGVLMLVPGWRAAAVLAQLGVMAIYTAIATVMLPGLWLDPFGSLLKNAAVLSCGALLLAMESLR